MNTQVLEEALQAAWSRHHNCREGKNAPYIPALAQVNPALDAAGNSVRGQKALTEVIARLGLNPLAA